MSDPVTAPQRQVLRRIDPARALNRDLAIYAKQRLALMVDAAKVQERIDNLAHLLLVNANERRLLDAAIERTERALRALQGPALPLKSEARDE